MPNLLTQYRRFAKDETGNIAIMFGLTAVVLLTAGGLAVEVSRAMTERSSMANALDAAVLATARSISLGEITRDEAEDYMNGMFAANLNVSAEDAAGYRIENIQFDEVTKTLSANGARDFNAMFRFFGENNALTLRANAAALYGTTYVEVAMTFDVTGSMKGARLRDLKSAATEGVTLLLGDGESETVRVSSVPYAEAVNAGSLARYVFPDDGGANTAPLRLGDFTTMIESGQRPAGLSPQANLSGSGPLAKDTCATERKGEYAVLPDGPDRAMVNRDDRLSVCPTVALIPLTNDADRLTSSIQSFAADGVTAGQIGIQWAWYMLAPEWADYLPEGSKPRDPATSSETVKKYAIIMTDGEFNTAFSGSNRQPPRNGPQGNETARATNQALALCEAMKDDGITVFTIGFGLRDGTRAMNMLSDCATPQDGAIQYFYSATTGADLTAAYTEISRTIQSLRLVR